MFYVFKLLRNRHIFLLRQQSFLLFPLLWQLFLPIMGILFAVFIVSKSGITGQRDGFISISGIWSFIKEIPKEVMEKLREMPR